MSHSRSSTEIEADLGPGLHPRAFVYLLVGAVPLVAAAASGDAPLAALGLPFLLALLGALTVDTLASEAAVTAELSTDRPAVAAGEPVEVTIRLSGSRPVARCRVELLRRFPGFGPDGPTESELASQIGAAVLDRPARWLCRLTPDEATELSLELVPVRAGELFLGPLRLVCSGPFGLYRRRLLVEETLRLQVRAGELAVGQVPRSTRVRVAVGDRLARHTGEGIELAEVRPERPGDRHLAVNWRATARRGVTHVSLRHPEQSTDVVLFADTFDPFYLPRVVEVAASSAAAYLARRDRVGLVCFGGVLDWVEAGAGSRQLERIRLRLAATSPFFSYAWKSIDRIPHRAMPAGALVIAISPLTDERATAAVAELRARGHDVVVVELVRGLPEPRGGLQEAALSLYEMEKEDLRRRLFELGIAVAPLEGGQSLAAVLAGLGEATRRLRPAVRR